MSVRTAPARTALSIATGVLITLIGPLSPTLAVSPAPTVAQVPDDREDIAAQIDRLRGHVGKRGEHDDAAIAILDVLVVAYPELGPHDRADVVRAVSKCFAAKRGTDEAGVPQNKLHIAAAVTLGEMGPESVKELSGWLANRRFRKDVALRRRLALALGKTQDEHAVRALLELLAEDEALLVSASARALGGFEGADGDLRKKIFSELLDVLLAAKKEVDEDVRDVAARERYNAFAPEIVSSLGRLARHDERDPDAWYTWWRENRREDWDDA